MIIQLDGLDFKVHSPSDLELISVRQDVDDPSARVWIRYNGFRKWYIDYRSKTVNLQRVFNSRDAAVALIASRAL
jgi:hypothetical protein